MVTKRDISSRDDINSFLIQFYERVRQDATIGIIFTEIIPVNWEHHIPLITDFWETILLDNPVYSNNAMEKHFQINKRFPLREEHFNAWLKLFNTTLDETFEGPVSSLAKKRAKSIAALMQLKMSQANSNKL